MGWGPCPGSRLLQNPWGRLDHRPETATGVEHDGPGQVDPQRLPQDFLDALDRDERELGADIVWDVVRSRSFSFGRITA